MRRVTHYGLCDLAYSSYILDGMYRVAESTDLAVTVERKIPDDYLSAAGGHENMQMILLFDATDEGGETIRFCIDNHDKAQFVHPGLIDHVDTYFKLNHDPVAIDRLCLPQRQRRKIQPLGSPVSPLRLNRWVHRPGLRPVPEVGWAPRNMVRRVRQLRQLATYEEIQKLRTDAKATDVVFIIRIYNESHHEPLNELRYEVARRLRDHPDINATIGLLGRSDGKYGEFATAEISTTNYLEQLAASRVGLYVFGPHRCLSFKLAELLALGLPVVGMSIPQDHHNLGSIPVLAEQFAYDDPTSLVEGVAKVLDDQSRLVDLSRRNIELFESRFAPEPTARRILDQLFDEA